MKKIINKWLLLILFGISFTACNKVLDDVDRVGAIIPDQVWNNAEYVEYYVNNLYGQLPAWNQDYYNNGEAGNNVGNTNSFFRGTNSSADAYPGAFWDYSVVRVINEFFANIYGAKIEVTQKKYLTGQVHFFRAYVYYKMVSSFGGVPIITTVQDPTSDIKKLMVSRNSTAECFKFIEAELDSAISLLPPRGTSGYADGRITKAAAMAVKGQVLLLKASPLFCITKNQQYWTDAYNANLAAKNELDAEGYGLYTNPAFNVHEMMWYDKDGAAKEMVLSVKYQYPSKCNSIQQAQRPLSNSAGAAGAGEPTWELVCAYPMRNGKNITDLNSGYDEKTFWKDRDPRFYSTIVYNGAHYGFGTDASRLQWLCKGMTSSPDGFEGSNGTATGFYCRKGIDTTKTLTTFPQQAFDWPVLRYTEVLLNLAECANETSKSSEAKTYLVAIRNRAHILPGVNNNYGLDAAVGTDYNKTLTAIMKERQIEFVFEGKRLYDLRRRRMFQELRDYGTLHAYAPTLDRQALIALNISGISVNANSSIDEILSQLADFFAKNPTFDKDNLLKSIFTYEQIALDRSGQNKIVLPDRNYFAPLNPDWIKLNTNLKQNTGWDNGDFVPTIQ
jgi:hypothetical protein